MPYNLEVKARVDDPAALRARVEELADTQGELLHQEDVFYEVGAGRLKLRTMGESRAELIHYHRPDSAGPSLSDYTIAPTSDPDALRRILGAVLPVLGVVRKERLLYLVGQTRVHLDRVEGLGDFLELEVVLGPAQAEEDGVRVAERLMERLGVERGSLVEGAYLDLLLAGRRG